MACECFRYDGACVKCYPEWSKEKIELHGLKIKLSDTGGMITELETALRKIVEGPSSEGLGHLSEEAYYESLLERCREIAKNALPKEPEEKSEGEKLYEQRQQEMKEHTCYDYGPSNFPQYTKREKCAGCNKMARQQMSA